MTRPSFGCYPLSVPSLVTVVVLFGCALGNVGWCEDPPKYALRPSDSRESTSQPEGYPKTTTLFQELDIKRTPRFAVLGVVTAQDLRYQMLSELKVGEPDERGVRSVKQTVLETRLVAADELSKAIFEQSLKALKGSAFIYKLNRAGEVVDFAAGPAQGPQAAAVAGKGVTGFLITSVMDDDGWKEMAQLSFFVPDEPTSGKSVGSRQMTHDFGPLGSWYGKTNFFRKGMQAGMLRVDYVHQLKYKPPGKDRGGLPFAIQDANFKPLIAGGTIRFDTKSGRVQSAEERFVVKGTISTEILGEALTAEIDEQQVLVVRILDQNPWKSP